MVFCKTQVSLRVILQKHIKDILHISFTNNTFQQNYIVLFAK